MQPKRKRDLKLQRTSLLTLARRFPLAWSLHGNETDKPVEFNLSVEPETTFKTLKNLTAKTTRIPSDNQLLVIKGQEWKMEEHGRICDDWLTNDLVAIFEVPYLSPQKVSNCILNNNKNTTNWNEFCFCFLFCFAWLTKPAESERHLLYHLYSSLSAANMSIQKLITCRT